MNLHCNDRDYSELFSVYTPQCPGLGQLIKGQNSFNVIKHEFPLAVISGSCAHGPTSQLMLK